MIKTRARLLDSHLVYQEVSAFLIFSTKSIFEPRPDHADALFVGLTVPALSLIFTHHQALPT